MKRYDGQVAVVTGASSGIGRRLATDLARCGAVVIGIARRKALLDEVEGVQSMPCDVSDTDAYRSALSAVEAAHGRVDILINDAGIEEPSPALDDDLTVYERIFATNFYGTVAGTLAVLPGMVARGHGIVVNVSSDSARAPAAGNAAYAALKAALSAFTESVAHEVWAKGVRVHVLYPGWVPTPMGMAGVEQGGDLPPKMARRTESQVSRLTLDRMGGKGIELNAVKPAVLASIARAFFPRMYRRSMASQRAPARR